MSSKTSAPTTDVPNLHGNLLLGSLQLLFWLLFKPSVWRKYLDDIDSSLKPDFTLVELSPTQRRNPALLGIIRVSCFIRTLCVGTLVWLFLSLTGAHTADVAFGVALSVGVGIASVTVGDISAGIAVGLAGGFIGGLVSGIGFGLVGVASVSGVFMMSTKAVISLGVASCFGLGVAGGTINTLSTQTTGYSSRWQVGFGMALVLCSGIYGLAFLAYSLTQYLVTGVAFDVAIELELAICFGVLVGCLTRSRKLGLAIGSMFAVLAGSAVLAFQVAKLGLDDGWLRSSVLGVTAGLADGMLICVFYVTPYALTRSLAGAPAGVVAGMLGAGGVYLFFSVFVSNPPLPLRVGLVAALVYTLLGLAVMWWRSVLFYVFMAPWNVILLTTDERRPITSRSRLQWNAAFWDELQLLPQVGLKEHLVLTLERNPIEGRAAIEYLVTGRQRWAVQAAQIEMDARRLERCSDVAEISRAFKSLTTADEEGLTSTLLRNFRRACQDVAAALEQVSPYNQRLTLIDVDTHLDQLINEIDRSNNRDAKRFRPIASRWRTIVASQIARLADESERRHEINNPYVVGVPLNERQRMFVGRHDVAALIERQILSEARAAMLLYGQRRMGKTSLFHSLGRLLPRKIVPMFVNLQGSVDSNTPYAGFLYNIAHAMRESAYRHRSLALSKLALQDLSEDPFTTFKEWLDSVEGSLGESTALLEFDELDALVDLMPHLRFRSEDVLGMLRYLIQDRPCFRILLASSHTLEEMQHLSSYLVNVHVVKIDYLNKLEARQLVERPIKDFALRYEDAASRRVWEITRGHPALIQLLCYNIVALKNEQDPAIRWTVSVDDVGMAMTRALEQGTMFLFMNIKNEAGRLGQKILRFIASHGEGATIERGDLECSFSENLDDSLDLLLRRQLIEQTRSGFRFQVEMIRCWFAKSES